MIGDGAIPIFPRDSSHPVFDRAWVTVSSKGEPGSGQNGMEAGAMGITRRFAGANGTAAVAILLLLAAPAPSSAQSRPYSVVTFGPNGQIVSVAPGPMPTPANDAVFRNGLAARGAWEQWFNSLDGDYKIGAFYWAGQRSLPHPGSCEQMDADFLNGCTAAKERLAIPDAMRQTEPEYKLGWNAWTPATSPIPAPQLPASPPIAPPPTPATAEPAPVAAPTPAAAGPGMAAPRSAETATAETSSEALPATGDEAIEEGFITQIDKAAAAYESAPNEMAQGAVRVMRARALCALLPGGEVRDWTGTIETLSSTSDGHGVLSIRISPHITVSTMNNGFSEALGNQRTLISVGSPLWTAVVRLSTNQHVTFSGRFSAGADCFEETSLTVGGGMADPEFIMKFFSVEPEPQ